MRSRNRTPYEPRVTRGFAQSRAAAVLSAVVLCGLLCAPRVPQTEAAWADTESASGSFTAIVVPTPISTADCVTNPGLLGLDPKVTVYWRVPAGATGYTVANAEYGYMSGGVLLPLTSALLGYVNTTGTPAAYTTVASSGLLGGLLGGTSVFAIRLVGPGGWHSSWLRATASMGLAGANPSCILSTVPST